MKIYEVHQRSDDWFRLRRGMPTASMFDMLLTPRKLEPSSQQKRLIYQLIAERFMGASVDLGQTHWMERGEELEPEAVAYYELHTGNTVTTGGFMVSDCGRYGASPDGRVYDDNGFLAPMDLIGGCEIKCPRETTHVEYALNPGLLSEHYRHQAAGCMLVSGTTWWDVMSYHPLLLPAVIERIEMSDVAEYMVRLEKELDAFCDRLEDARQRMLDRGFVEKRPEPARDLEKAYEELKT